jgi:hypothetical protein
MERTPKGAFLFSQISSISWNQIENAFSAGYDPALELATYQGKPGPPAEVNLDEDPIDELEGDGPWQHLRRKEQKCIDDIVHGREPGHYFVLLGPKVSLSGPPIILSVV